MDIILFGIQGSGKGTLGKAVADKYGMSYFETGAELRKLSQEDSELGKKVKSIIEAGNLVSNDIVMEIVEDFMTKNDDGKAIVIDGVPRFMEQSQTLEKLLQDHNHEYVGVLVDIPEELAIKRLTTRRICSKCKEVYPANYSKEVCEKCGGELITRSDDTPDSIKTRIDAYNNETIPVIEHFKEIGKLHVIDGKPPIPEAREIIFNLIDNKIKA